MSENTQESVLNNQINQQKPAQTEQQELANYREGLIKVHNQLKQHADLFTALKGYGINNVEDLARKFQGSVGQPQGGSIEEEADVLNSPYSEEETGGGDSQNKQVESLKGEVEQLRDMVLKDSWRGRTNELKYEIMSKIKGDPKYTLLEKAMDSQVAHNILSRMQQDNEQGKNYDLSHYMNTAENELRAYFQKLGGQVNPQPQQKQPQSGANTDNLLNPQNQPVARQAETNQPQRPVLNEKSQGTSDTITFPSLPSSSAEPTRLSGDEEYKRFMEKGKNPFTGKIDPDVAFEKNLTEWVSKGEPS